MLEEKGFEGLFAFSRRYPKWDELKRRPEFWGPLSAGFPNSMHVRFGPVPSWTECDIWCWTECESIPNIPLYCAKKRAGCSAMNHETGDAFEPLRAGGCL